MTEPDAIAAAEPPLDCRVRAQTPLRRLLFVEGDGWAICPFCWGTGSSPTAATTNIAQCDNCGGEGRVRAR